MITERCPPPDWEAHDELEGSEPFEVALAERVDYLMVATATARAGSELTLQEQARLRRLCRELELPEREAQRVLAYINKDMRSDVSPR
jgi:hypothetical protein